MIVVLCTTNTFQSLSRAYFLSDEVCWQALSDGWWFQSLSRAYFLSDGTPHKYSIGSRVAGYSAGGSFRGSKFGAKRVPFLDHYPLNRPLERCGRLRSASTSHLPPAKLMHIWYK